MVIEPKENIVDKLIKVLENQDISKRIGDQYIIEIYYNWESKKNLQLEEKYNMFADYIDYYINNNIYTKEDIAVVHFIGQNKPWMLNKEQIIEYKEKCKKENKNNQLAFFEKYIKYL